MRARLNGEDTAAFIVSANINRRNLSKGQKAMAMAMIYPEPKKGGRGKKAPNPTETLGFSAMRLSQARSVQRHSRALADRVVDGEISLDTALDQVEREREAAVSAEAQLSELSQHAPDQRDAIAPQSSRGGAGAAGAGPG